MLREMFLRSMAVCLSCAALLVGHEASGSEASIAVGEVSTPPPASGTDAAALRAAAEGEIRQMDPTLPRARRVVVSLALTRAEVNPVACTINATIRDARSGSMIAIIEAGAEAQGPVSTELRQQVASAAVRRAVRRIPHALGGR
jgi:hypothetical protein